MSVKIQIDPSGNPIMPTLILARHSGYKLGKLNNPYNIVLEDVLMEESELSFMVNKEYEPLWKSILDFKLIYVMEWDKWLQIKVELVDGDSTTKKVSATSLGKSELSQILLHGLEFNTEDDIADDEYVRRIIYNPINPAGSILSTIMEKAPHYRIAHVDSSIAQLFKTFEFDDTSIDDALGEISQECHCLIKYNDGSDPDTGMPLRELSLYDLETICQNCGHRGEFSDVCPECGSTNLKYGYGTDTTIFVSKDNLTDEVTYTTDVDSVKNTFKLKAGDDVMTSAIQACNPNGTDYIQYINVDTKNDMPDELVQKIEQYEDEFQYYQNEHEVVMGDIANSYNNLVDSYNAQLHTEYAHIPDSIIGFPALMNAIYDVIDFQYFIENALMPVYEINNTTAALEAAKLNAENLSPIGISKDYHESIDILNNLVLGIASYVVDKRFYVKIKESHLAVIGGQNKWVGTFTVISYDDETVEVDSHEVALSISNESEQYIRQRIKKVLAATESDKKYSIASIIEPETSLPEFKNLIKLYNINILYNINDTCLTCMDTLQMEGIAKANHSMHDEYYMNYYNKQQATLKEILLKEKQRDEVIIPMSDALNVVRNEIQDTLNFETYLGTDLYKIFCSYRREDVYQNDNYISDGLNNAQIFENAREFYATAQKEIFRSAVLQHSISATLKNLLVIPEFAPIRDHFELGSWIRIKVDDEIFRLRLIRYEVDFDNLPQINVEFSDVTRVADGISDIDSLLNHISSMASSYGAVAHQVEAEKATKVVVDNWLKSGFDATLTRIVNDDGKQDVVIDNHGILIRSYDDVTDSYADTQFKFINSILAITDDNWQSIRTALGNFIYQDPDTGTLKEAYGLLAETIVGDLILGRTLKIRNEDMNMTVDKDGLSLTNGANSFYVTPNEDTLLALLKGDEKMFWVDEHGMLHIKGDGAGLDIQFNDSITGIQAEFQVTKDGFLSRFQDLGNSITTINQTINEIVLRAENTQQQLLAQIRISADEIHSMVSDGLNKAQSDIIQTANQISLNVEDIKNNLEASISLTADEIRSEVYNKELHLGSLISQTADSIRSDVYSAQDGMWSYVLQTKDKIETDVHNYVDGLSSRITQTDNEIRLTIQNEVDNINSTILMTDREIRTEIHDVAHDLGTAIQQTDSFIRSDVYAVEQGLQTYIEQTQNKIESDVHNYVEGLNTRITQTDREIRSYVFNEVDHLGSIISQTDSSIRAMVVNEVQGLTSIISQTDEEIQHIIRDEINDLTTFIYQNSETIILSVNDEVEKLSASININAESIQSLVGDTSQILQTLNNIVMSVGGSSFELTDGMINAVADQINLQGLITLGGLSYGVTSRLDLMEDNIDKIEVGLGNVITQEHVAELIRTQSGHSVYYNKKPPNNINNLDTEYKSAAQNANEGDIWWEEYYLSSDYDNQGNLKPTAHPKRKCWMYVGNRWIEKPDGRVVIENGTIGANLIAADAITADKFAGSELASLNYYPDTSAGNTVGYAGRGMLIDLAGGGIQTKNFVVKNTGTTGSSGGEVYVRGTIYATSLVIGGPTTKIVNGQEVSVDLATESEITALNERINGLDIPEGMTESQIVDIVSNYGFLDNTTLNSALANSSYVTVSTTYQDNDPSKTRTDVISINGTQVYTKITKPDSDFLILSQKIGSGTNVQSNSNYFCISKDGLIEANNAVIYGDIHANSGWFSGTLRATNIECPNANYNVESVLKYKAIDNNYYGIIHQLINDSAGTLYRATLGNAGKLYLPYDIHFEYSSAHATDTYGEYLGRGQSGNDNKGDLSVIIQDIYEAINDVQAYSGDHVNLIGSTSTSGTDNLQIVLNNNGTTYYAAAPGHTHSYNDLTNKPTIPSLSGYATENWVNGYFAAENHTHNRLYGGAINNDVFGWNSQGTGVMCDGAGYMLGSSSNRFTTVYLGNNPDVSSDIRYKTILSNFDSKYKNIFMSIKPVVYKYKNEQFDCDKIHWGIIAQDIRNAGLSNSLSEDEIAPLSIGEEDGMYGVSYGEAQMLAWYVTQENTHDIESLQSKLNYMEKENNMLKKYISELADKIDQLSNKLKGR